MEVEPLVRATFLASTMKRIHTHSWVCWDSQPAVVVVPIPFPSLFVLLSSVTFVFHFRCSCFFFGGGGVGIVFLAGAEWGTGAEGANTKLATSAASLFPQ